MSDVKPEMDDVPILNRIFLALKAQTTGTFGTAFAVILNVVFVPDHFGFNEAFFEVSMDNASRLRCTDASSNSPGPRFLGPGSKISLQV